MAVGSVVIVQVVRLKASGTLGSRLLARLRFRGVAVRRYDCHRRLTTRHSPSHWQSHQSLHPARIEFACRLFLLDHSHRILQIRSVCHWICLCMVVVASKLTIHQFCLVRAASHILDCWSWPLMHFLSQIFAPPLVRRRTPVLWLPDHIDVIHCAWRCPRL